MFEDKLPDKPDYLTDHQWSKDLASWAIAREDVVMKLKKNHYDTMDTKRELIKLRMEIELPFVCEDIFMVKITMGCAPM